MNNQQFQELSPTLKLNIKKAFLSPFSDYGWFWKITLLGVLCTLSLGLNVSAKIGSKYLLIGFLIGFLVEMIKTGYFIKFIHNEIYDIKPLLPVWKYNILDFLKKGTKYYIVLISYIILFLILFALFIAFPVSIFFASSEIVSNIILIFFGILYAIFGMIFTQLVMCSYADNLKYENCYQFKFFLKLILNVKKEIVITLLFVFVFCTLTLIFSEVIIKSNNLFVLITMNLLTPYFIVIELFTLYNLSAQTYKIAKYRIYNNSEI